MQLPEELQHAIEGLLGEGGSTKTLTAAHTTMSDRYRHGGNSHPAFKDRSQLLAYLVARFPATFAACRAVFQTIRMQAPSFACHTLLDLGAGPGAASWAATQVFGELQQLHLIERESDAIAVGKKLSVHGISTHWVQGNLEEPIALPKADLAILSYSLGELTQPTQLLERLWANRTPLIAIVEPGTPRGFQNIRKWREEWIRRGAQILAPCPHLFACPMQGSDWCHFAARVERSRLHRQLKGGSLGYEDEKFSYLVLAQPEMIPEPIDGRVLRHPEKSKGQVRLSLCYKTGEIQEINITRKQEDSYRAAKKLEWGDAWNYFNLEKEI